MTPADPFGLVGAIVDGRYRVLRVVGQGGFGVVYRAQHLGFDSPMALKLLKLPDECSSPRREARIVSFQREGRVLFELSHLHASVLRAHETGTIRGRDGSLAPYLALEWLDGVSLAAELKARRGGASATWPLHSALELLHGPAEALAIAHARGIAHRDVKPANLFIAIRDGEQCVKILDFGIAKLVVDTAADTTEHAAQPLASTASFTPLYAAPEQWVTERGATGAWTDVHALALVLVEMLGGRQPFWGSEPAELMVSCLNPRRPTPAALGVDVSAEVEAVFARALALEPRDRYPEVGAFWGALAAAACWSPAESGPAIQLFAEAGQGATERPTGWNDPPRLDTTATTARSVSLSNPRKAGTLASRLGRAGAISAAIAASVAVFGAHATRVSSPPSSPKVATVKPARTLVALPSHAEAASSCTDVERQRSTPHAEVSAAPPQVSRAPRLAALRSATQTVHSAAPSADASADTRPRAVVAPTAAVTAVAEPAPAPAESPPSRRFPRFD